MNSKWPKHIEPMTAEERAVYDDWQRIWLQRANRHPGLARFNHGYVLAASRGLRGPTLEVGAGLGEHVELEAAAGFPLEHYHVAELMPSMARFVRGRFTQAHVLVADCQEPLPYRSESFERIVAIHVLEHLPNLPAFLREASRLLTVDGQFIVVIPCEGGLAYSLARRLTSQAMYEQRYKLPYGPHIRRDHVNSAPEILAEVETLFTVEQRRWWPLRLPAVDLNLCVGLSLRPRPGVRR